jgi:hypothetical protein
MLALLHMSKCSQLDVHHFKLVLEIQSTVGTGIVASGSF